MRNLILLLLCSVSMLGTLMAQNLLFNGDFETGDLTGWNPGADAAINVNVFNEFAPMPQPANGSRALKIFGRFNGVQNDNLMFQEHLVSPGDQIDASVEMFHPSSGLDNLEFKANVAFMRLGFFDAGGAEIDPGIAGVNSDLFSGLNAGDTWTPFNISATAPAGAVTVQYFLFFIQPLNESGAVFYDNAVLRNITEEQAAAIPTMSQWALMILGLIMVSIAVVFIKRRVYA
ncbi:MAG: IPTL-CTERM sorting domain-containing protein [Bacteroidia bacterium]|nr:IPTL-CTERM sorting domain-containing protein [Bacteroidia bacterium]